MSKNLNISTPETETTDAESMQTGVFGLTSDAMARRRMLLKSLGKGSSVIAAAAIPMHTLAATGTLAKTANGMRCTVSGNQSAIHSQTTVSDVCVGYSPGYYKMVSHWPNYNSTTTLATNSFDTKTFTQNSKFSDVFGGSSSIGSITLIDIMKSYPSSEEFHWIAALLNSLPGSPATNFPYFASKVVGFYLAAEPMRTNALNFFKGYMEVHN
ncbi:hypothetical protein [Rhodoferax sp.]|uniref:hypothetical protein n=1 Tax=Rhodoferax sp. TaxID=50421 RepID=UPI0025FCAD0A|nr:hypothetical protein [Rhodoferax sp.]